MSADHHNAPIANEGCNLKFLGHHTLNYCSLMYSAIAPHYEAYQALRNVSKAHQRFVEAIDAAQPLPIFLAMEDLVTMANSFYKTAQIAQLYSDDELTGPDPGKRPPEDQMHLLDSPDFNPRNHLFE